MKECVINLSDIQKAFVIDESVNTLTVIADNHDNFSQFVHLLNTSPVLPFSRLRLNLTLEMLETEEVSALINALNNSPLQCLQLTFPTDTINENSLDIANILNDVTNSINYPIVVGKDEQGVYTPVPHPHFTSFQNTIINNIQEKNWSRRSNSHDMNAPHHAMEDRSMLLVDEQPSKKIKLKELMKKRHANDNYNQYIKLEVQFVEVEQQQIEEVVEVAEVVQQVEQQAYERYNGDLVGYDKFHDTCHEILEQYPLAIRDAVSHAIHNELFGNVPHAIKFLTPVAAKEIANNYPNFAFLNKENLPQQFLLKKTAQGEFVLDFDPFTEEKQTNIFTPKATPVYSKDPIYPINLDRDDVEELINNSALFNAVCFTDENYNPEKLINLWINYGDQGIAFLFERLTDLDASHRKFSLFLLNNYLIHFSQWDHFLANDDFINALERIKNYDATKLNCLKKFLENTGASQHNLKDTVEAFDAFWADLHILCNDQNATIDRINGTWSTPQGGSPVVYMERLLTILKNSRNLGEQITCLSELTLDNYGAYYASNYEGFKVVSREMELNYDAKTQESLPFNPEGQLYRTDENRLQHFIQHLDNFIQSVYFREKNLFLIKDASDTLTADEFEMLEGEKVLPFTRENFVPPYQLYSRNGNVLNKIASIYLDKDKFYALAYRFIGQQNKGITIPAYVSDFNKFRRKFYGGVNFSSMVFTSLFFVTHDRFKKTSLMNLFDCLYKACIHKEVINSINEYLFKLYKLDIRLNEIEGNVICQRISMMNSAEFEGEGHDKSIYIAKLFKQLQDNKYGVLKCLEKINENAESKWPFVYALDAADFFAEDPAIASTYRDDLLLFSTLLNGERKEAYCKNIKVKNAAQIVENISEVKEILAKAASGEKPNNLDYAFKIIVQSRNYFRYAQFLPAMREIEDLPEFDFQAVDEILASYKFKIKAAVPELFQHDNNDLKALMVLLILALEEVKENGLPKDIGSLLNGPKDALEELAEWERAYAKEENAEAKEDMLAQKESLDEKQAKYDNWCANREQLSCLKLSELQEHLNDGWQRAGLALSLMGKTILKPLLSKLKTSLIDEAFKDFPQSPFKALLISKIHTLQNFADDDDFEKINRIYKEASFLSPLFDDLINRENFNTNADVLIELFAEADFSCLDYETLYAIIDLLLGMPQRNYAGILAAIFNKEILEDKEKCLGLLSIIWDLHSNNFPSDYIEKIASHYTKAPPKAPFRHAIHPLIPAFCKDNDDKLVKFIITSSALPFTTFATIIELTGNLQTNRDAVFYLLTHLQSDSNPSLTSFIDRLPHYTNGDLILEIIAKSFAASPNKNLPGINFNELITLIANLDDENVTKLHTFFTTTTANIKCLYDSLKERDVSASFDVFLQAFEKAPFGMRDFNQQFDVSEVSRVVNESLDLVNQSVQPFDYRKKMMEAFLFVNQAGFDLTVYNNKAAKDLSNLEIKELFLQIKRDDFNQLDPFQKRLYALGLMREAMYRSTGQFPYSTQIIGLIDCLMHKGDVISNIDTGQGKSLIDVMKATLLWLESDRVDISTSSLVDAKRDIGIYGPFLSSLGIPHSSAPITASSTADDYQENGINFSTFAQLSLFFSKARAENRDLGNKADKVSLIINESDFSILDDRVIYRYASSSNTGPGVGNDWVYYAINAFVNTRGFTQNNTSEAKDIHNLRNYLREQALLNGKLRKFVNRFDDAQLLTWIESAILVNYKLRENFDYVLTPPEVKCINGVSYLTRSTKIIMADGKISPDSLYGNGIQQLLYARYNENLNENAFVIEPETTTLLSSNNKNLVDYYRRQKGFIWGSSGTVGSLSEINEQYNKYGFEFSKIAPHQENKVVRHKPVILANEILHFDRIIKQLEKNKKKKSAITDIVFFKDISTAKRFHDYLLRSRDKDFVQLYIGTGNEEEVVEKAAIPGMITITTSALGRNTDILYDKKIGMNVIDTCVDSLRRAGQKAGRTGRQGSPGQVFYFFNQDDLHASSPDEITTLMDQKSREERAFTEELYDVLDYLLDKTDAEKEDVRHVWANYYTTIEAMYSQLRINAAYTREDFIREAVVLFNRDFNQEVLPEDVLKSVAMQHERALPYSAAKRNVELSDCISPAFIAYHMLSVNAIDESSEAEKTAIKTQLEHVFTQLQKGQYEEGARDYFTFLNGSNSSLKSIYEAHSEFLTTFLCETTAASSNRSFIERWFGHESRLMTIANNDNYLLLFKAFIKSDKNAGAVSLDTLKPAVLTLLKEYLETGWFINKSRKTACLSLINAINDAPDIESIIAALADKKITAIKEDISANKNSFWRKIKAINKFGESRFQNSLDKALALTTTLSGKQAPDDLLNDLTSTLKEVTPTPDALQVFEQQKNMNTYFTSTASLRLRDKGNGRVLQTSIEKRLRSEEQDKAVTGMLGRGTFFSHDEANGLLRPDIAPPAAGA